MSPIISRVGSSFGFNAVKKRVSSAPVAFSCASLGGTLGFTTTTISSDPGDAWFSAGNVLYNGSSSDESSYSFTLPFDVCFLGTAQNQIKVSSNSYFCFGNPAFPSFSFNAGNPAAPGIAVCAHTGSSTDTNIQYLAWRQDGDIVKMRWKGGYPYSFSTVNRVWDVIFTKNSNQYTIETRTITAKDSSGNGNIIIATNSSSVVASSGTPSNGSAFILTAP